MISKATNSSLLTVFVAGILFGTTGCAQTETSTVATEEATATSEVSEVERFPPVEIINVFEPEGESNVRSSIRLADGVALIGTEERGNVFKTLDSGMTWQKTTDGAEQWGIQDMRNVMRAQDGHLYATTSEPALVLRSENEGESWEKLVEAPSSRTVGIVQLDDSTFLVGLRRSENDKTSIIRSTDGFETFDWIPISENEPRQNVTCFQNLGGSTVLAGVGYEGSGKIYRSVDSGLTWTKTGEFEDARDIMAFYEENGAVYVMSSGIATLFASSDDGRTWEKAYQFWPKGFIGSTATFEWNEKTFRLIPGTDQSGETPRHVVMISDDMGETWQEWIELEIDPQSVQGGGASNLAVISDDTIVVGVGNHAVQGRCFTLRIR